MSESVLLTWSIGQSIDRLIASVLEILPGGGQHLPRPRAPVPHRRCLRRRRPRPIHGGPERVRDPHLSIRHFLTLRSVNKTLFDAILTPAHVKLVSIRWCAIYNGAPFNGALYSVTKILFGTM